MNYGFTIELDVTDFDTDEMEVKTDSIESQDLDVVYSAVIASSVIDNGKVSEEKLENAEKLTSAPARIYPNLTEYSEKFGSEEVFVGLSGRKRNGGIAVYNIFHPENISIKYDEGMIRELNRDAERLQRSGFVTSISVAGLQIDPTIAENLGVKSQERLDDPESAIGELNSRRPIIMEAYSTDSSLNAAIYYGMADEETVSIDTDQGRWGCKQIESELEYFN